ncbi:MAG: WD40/YVTN/BNR-like repeat-containing protein, partial [Flammeovirgaceae bacterium]
MAANGSNIFAGTYEGLFRSTNNGASWTLVGSTVMQTSKNIVSVAAYGNNVFAATSEDGLFRSLDNGLSWAKVLDEDAIRLLILDDGIIFGGNRDVFVSTDNGTNWVAAGIGLPKV